MRSKGIISEEAWHINFIYLLRNLLLNGIYGGYASRFREAMAYSAALVIIPGGLRLPINVHQPNPMIDRNLTSSSQEAPYIPNFRYISLLLRNRPAAQIPTTTTPRLIMAHTSLDELAKDDAALYNALKDASRFTFRGFDSSPVKVKTRMRLEIPRYSLDRKDEAPYSIGLIEDPWGSRDMKH